MFKIILKPLTPNRDYRFVQMKDPNGDYINIKISLVDNCLWLMISKSTDGGFFFTDVTEDYKEISIENKINFDNAINYVIEYFSKIGYLVLR